MRIAIWITLCLLPTALSALPQAQPKETGLIVCWSLGSGSGKGPACEEHNVEWAKGRLGRALALNGRNSCLQARDSMAGNIRGAFTISFWIDPAAWSDQYSAGIVSKKASD